MHAHAHARLSQKNMVDVGNLSSSLVCELRGHTNDVNSCAWSPVSSQLLCSCGGDATFRVWDISKATPTSGGKSAVPSSALVKTVKAHDYYVNSIAFNPSGDVLATASSDNTVKLWSTATWTEIGVCVGRGGGSLVNQTLFRSAGCIASPVLYIWRDINHDSKQCMNVQSLFSLLSFSHIQFSHYVGAGDAIHPALRKRVWFTRLWGEGVHARTALVYSSTVAFLCVFVHFASLCLSKHLHVCKCTLKYTQYLFFKLCQIVKLTFPA